MFWYFRVRTLVYIGIRLHLFTSERASLTEKGGAEMNDACAYLSTSARIGSDDDERRIISLSFIINNLLEFILIQLMQYEIPEMTIDRIPHAFRIETGA